jgi:hypothetical protein
MEKNKLLNYDINEKFTFDTNHDELYIKLQELLDILTNDKDRDYMKHLCVEIVDIKSLLKGKYKVNKNDIEFIKTTTNNILERLILHIQTKNEPILLLNKLMKEVIFNEENDRNKQINDLQLLNKKLINEIKELKVNQK